LKPSTPSPTSTTTPDSSEPDSRKCKRKVVKFITCQVYC
jgi:hypothetical protein